MHTDYVHKPVFICMRIQDRKEGMDVKSEGRLLAGYAFSLDAIKCSDLTYRTFVCIISHTGRLCV